MQQFLNNLIEFVKLIKLPIIAIIMVLALLKVTYLKFINDQYKQNLGKDSKTKKDTLGA